jgi:23S rRNA (guanosine2251-2'-O)-methyltransferase
MSRQGGGHRPPAHAGPGRWNAGHSPDRLPAGRPPREAPRTRFAPPAAPARPFDRADRPDPDADLVYGLHPCEAYLADAPDRVREVLVDAGAGPGPQAVGAAAKVAGVPVRVLPAEAFRDLARGRNFQGVALRVKPFVHADPDDLLALAAPGAVLVALDCVQDPQNLGSVLRSSAFFGAKGVLIPQDRAVGVTPVVVKASAGAAARVPVARVVNLARTLRQAAEGGWTVVGASARGGVRPADLPAGVPLLLVLGAEGEGLRRLVSEACDLHVTLPSPGGFESLNVGVAAGILLYQAASRAAGGTT